MSDPRSVLERESRRFIQADGAFERLQHRRDRKRRNQRVAAGVLGIVVFALAAIGFVRLLGSERTPADQSGPRPISPPSEAVPLPYEFLDGEVAFAAAPPWDYSFGGWDFTPTMTTLILNDVDQRAAYEQRVAVVADPLPVETGCHQGPAPADAAALARSIRSDPDLDATEPVAVRIGGNEALRMDVVAAPGASVCETVPAPQVLTPDDQDWYGVGLEHGHRMRLYLLDLPEGLSARILAIAISAPEPRFEHVVEAAAPIVDSFEFRR